MNNGLPFSEFADNSVDLRNGLSSGGSEDLHATRLFWWTHFDAYNPRVVFKPENLEHTITQLKRIDRSGDNTVIVSFARMSLDAVGVKGEGLHEWMKDVYLAVHGPDVAEVDVDV